MINFVKKASDIYSCNILFDAGYRSRVRYISVLDPTNMCYYVSEILDAGRDGPLFMVISFYLFGSETAIIVPCYLLNWTCF